METDVMRKVVGRWAMLIVLLTMVVRINSQAQNSGSLLKTIASGRNDSAQVLTLNEAALAVRDSNETLALQYAIKAKELATKIKFEKGLGPVLSNLGWIYYRQSDYVRAFEISTEALVLNHKMGNRTEMANSFYTIGLIDSRLGKYDSALIDFKNALDLFTEKGDIIGISKSLNSAAYCLVKLQKLDSARSNVLHSLNGVGNNNKRLAAAKRTLGDIFFEEHNYKEALKNFEESLKLNEASHDKVFAMFTRYRIGKTYIQLNNPDKALFFLNQNISAASKNKMKSGLKSTYQFTSDAYAQKKDFVSAYKYLVLANQQKDSINEQRSEQQFALSQARHESELKNAQIKLLTKDSLLKESEIKNQKRFIYLGVGSFAVLLALVFSIYRSYRNSKMANLLLISRNEMINLQKDELKNLNATKDKIFSIIGHDLRSPLTGIHSLLSLITKNAISQKEFLEFSLHLKQNLEYVQNDLDNLLNWANAQLKGVKPAFENVSAYHVVSEKINLLSEVAKPKNIIFKNQVATNVSIFTDVNHLDLVIRNLLANAIKFSQPGGIITVNTKLVNGFVQLTVTDTGVGMTDEEVNKLFKSDSHFTKKGTQDEKGMGLGLLLVKEFVQINNGSISVTSKPGQGSSFTVSLKGEYNESLNAKSA
jgi:signal transduction histidine kinase